MVVVIAGCKRSLAELDLTMKEALVVFAKAPIAGQVKTRLIGALTAEEVAQLYVCFLRDTFATMEVVQEERENLSLVLCFTPADEIEAFESADLDGCLMMAQHGDELFVFCDGSVHFFGDDFDYKLFNELGTRAGNETVTFP